MPFQVPLTLPTTDLFSIFVDSRSTHFLDRTLQCLDLLDILANIYLFLCLRVHSPLLLSFISLYVSVTNCLSIHLWEGIWIAFTLVYYN